jgi:hypothetical protein
LEFIARGIAKLETATLEQLQTSLVGFAENLVSITANCEEEHTRYALAMEMVSAALDQNIDAVSLSSDEPPTEATN